MAQESKASCQPAVEDVDVGTLLITKNSQKILHGR